MSLGTTTARAETPDEAVTRIWKASCITASGGFFASVEFWTLSRTIAHEQGIAVIAPIMAHAKDWKGEEEIIFVPLVYFLPPKQVIPLLTQYEKTGKPWEQQCATDLLTEITGDPKDLQEMDKQLPKE